jgi:hypothetical protein
MVLPKGGDLMDTVEALERRLQTEVRRRGIEYLSGPVAGASMRQDWPRGSFLAALAGVDDIRLRHTLIALLLLHPEYASAVQEARQLRTPAIAEELAVMVLAVLYLQREWHVQLALALGRPPAFPERPFAAWWEERDLPDPSVVYGEAGLLALEHYEQRRHHTAYAYRQAWESPVLHLLWQERHRRAKLLRANAIPGLTLLPDGGDPECPAYLAPVDRGVIARFVAQLAHLLHAPYRLYLGSESTLVQCGMHQRTEALDLHLGRGETPPPEVEDALARLRDLPGMNWVASSAASTIPLPPDWREHAIHLFTEGPVEVKALDWAAMAVAKIAQGTSRHLADIVALLNKGLVSRGQIEALFAAILPGIGHGAWYSSLDPEVVQQIYQTVFALA